MGREIRKPVQDRRPWSQLLVGIALTTLVVAADHGRLLAPLERKLYDLRCRYCQFFARAPVPPVHLDIDDAALQEIGGWPWPRGKMAQIVDELYGAGANVVVLDVVYPDAKPDEDTALAKSLAGGRSVIAVELSSPGGTMAETSEWQRLHEELFKDLELPPDQARSLLNRAGVAVERGHDRFEHQFVTARQEAMFRRVLAAIDGGETDPARLRRSLLPNTGTVDTSPLGRLFDEQFDLALRARALRPFFRPAPPSTPPALPAANQKPPPMPLIVAARGCGFVNYEPDADGVVRAIPLWQEVDGERLPQLGLVAACMALNVDARTVRFTPDALVIPRAPPQPDIVIPVSIHDFAELRDVPYCMNVPMLGRSNWEAMYDRPGGAAQSATHVSVLAAYRVALTKERVASNQSIADRALLSVLTVIDPEAAEDYVGRATADRPRDSMIATTVTQASSKLDELRAIPSPNEELARTIRALDEAAAALRRYPAINAQLEAQRVADAKALAALVAERTVFVGWTAEAQVDLVPTSLHQRCPGVVIHGAIYNAVMSGEMWRTLSTAYSDAATILLGMLITLIVSRTSPKRGLVSVLAATGIVAAVNGALLFDYFDLIVGLAGPVTVAGVVWSGLTVVKFVEEIKERARITRGFQRYVDPTLVDYLVKHRELARLDGEMREVTVVFTDLAGFTALSEKLRERIVKILGRYMSRMVPSIRNHRGLVHRFMGDGIMFSFNALIENREHAADAVATVMEMQQVLEAFNVELAVKDHIDPGFLPLVMRTGVSTGNAFVGDSGPEDASDFTCLGDVVNLGARLESANKAVGTRNLLSARTVELLEGRYLVRPIGRLVVVGKTEAVMTYEPLCAAADATPEQQQLADLTTEMHDHFKASRFAECVAAADRLEQAFAGSTKLATLHREACERCLTTPPADFQGHIDLQAK